MWRVHLLLLLLYCCAAAAVVIISCIISYVWAGRYANVQIALIRSAVATDVSYEQVPVVGNNGTFKQAQEGGRLMNQMGMIPMIILETLESEFCVTSSTLEYEICTTLLLYHTFSRWRKLCRTAKFVALIR